MDFMMFEVIAGIYARQVPQYSVFLENSLVVGQPTARICVFHYLLRSGSSIASRLEGRSCLSKEDTVGDSLRVTQGSSNPERPAEKDTGRNGGKFLVALLCFRYFFLSGLSDKCWKLLE